MKRYIYSIITCSLFFTTHTKAETYENIIQKISEAPAKLLPDTRSNIIEKGIPKEKIDTWNTLLKDIQNYIVNTLLPQTLLKEKTIIFSDMDKAFVKEVLTTLLQFNDQIISIIRKGPNKTASDEQAVAQIGRAIETKTKEFSQKINKLPQLTTAAQQISTILLALITAINTFAERVINIDYPEVTVKGSNLKSETQKLNDDIAAFNKKLEKAKTDINNLLSQTLLREKADLFAGMDKETIRGFLTTIEKLSKELVEKHKNLTPTSLRDLNKTITTKIGEFSQKMSNMPQVSQAMKQIKTTFAQLISDFGTFASQIFDKQNMDLEDYPMTKKESPTKKQMPTAGEIIKYGIENAYKIH